MATIYTLTIDPITLGLTKPVDRVYIKNLYVDIDDTHIKTAAFEYSSSVVGGIGFAELPATTLGSIYQIQLFGSEGLVLSVFFGMPTRNTKLSELDIYTAYPPRNFYPEATIAWGQINGTIANQLDLSSVMFTKSNAATLQEAIDAKNLLQDNAIDLKASIYDVDNKNALQDSLISDLQAKDVSQDTAIALKASITYVDNKNALQDGAIGDLQAKNLLQDTAIALKASITYVDNKNLSQDGAIGDLQSKNLSQDSEIALRAKITDVDAKNLLQDTAIGSLQDKSAAHESAIALKANASDVDAKNLLQDNAISANAADIVAIQAYAPQDRTISATGDATWSVTFNGSKNVAGVMTVKKGSTAQAGLLRLNNSVSSTSTTEAATPNAVKTTYDLAASAIPTAEKGAINGVATLGADGKIPADQVRPSATVLWGSITGNIAEQTDLTNLVYSKSEVDTKNDLQDTAITAAQNKADAAIPKTDKGAVNGVATLGGDGKVTPTQLPVVTPVAWGNITGSIAAQTDLSNTYFKIADKNTWEGRLNTAIANARKQGDFYTTTTTTYPNTFIEANGDMKRSTATFGTAAGKDVGANPTQIPLNSNLGTAAYKSFSEDANGFIRKVGSTSEAVIKDAAGVATVNGIQAGIDAPKIAYKKFEGTTNKNFSVAHGLNAAKILSISVTIFTSTGMYIAVTSAFAYWHDATNVVVSLGTTATNFANRPFTILITYEVD